MCDVNVTGVCFVHRVGGPNLEIAEENQLKQIWRAVVGREKSDVELRDFFSLAAPFNDRFEKLEKWIDGSFVKTTTTVGWRSKKGAQKAIKKCVRFLCGTFLVYLASVSECILCQCASSRVYKQKKRYNIPTTL